MNTTSECRHTYLEERFMGEEYYCSDCGVQVNEEENEMSDTTQLVSIKLLDEVGDHVGQADIFEREGNFVLYWTDFVVNEWEESFETMTQALSRLSVLHFAVSVGASFADVSPEAFAKKTNDFVESQIERAN